jgi:hypothetical protein
MAKSKRISLRAIPRSVYAYYSLVVQLVYLHKFDVISSGNNKNEVVNEVKIKHFINKDNLQVKEQSFHVY